LLHGPSCLLVSLLRFLRDLIDGLLRLLLRGLRGLLRCACGLLGFVRSLLRSLRRRLRCLLRGLLGLVCGTGCCSTCGTCRRTASCDASGTGSFFERMNSGLNSFD